MEAVGFLLLDSAEFFPAAVLGEHDPVDDYRLLGIKFAVGGEPDIVMHDVSILAPLDDKQRPSFYLCRGRRGQKREN